MNVWVFPVGIIALVIALFLRAPKACHPYKAFLFFLAGVIISAAGVRMLANRADIGRPTDFDYFIADSLRLLDAEPQAPFIVFSGASFSRNGLDDDRLTSRLRQLGYPHRVINLSLQGSSLQERHAALMRFLKRADRKPDLALLMVAPEFDMNAAYVFQVATFSDRAIGQFTPDAAAWAALGMMRGDCQNTVQCAKTTILGPLHLTMNVLNLGLLSGGRDLATLAPQKVYDAKQDVREPISDEEIRQGVLAQIHPTAQVGPHWAASFRKQQRDDLQALGVGGVAYYLPPVISPQIREYTASLCLGELANWPCIAPLGPALLEPLDGQIWFDPKHLKQEGAEHYSDWLADEIDRRGLLR